MRLRNPTMAALGGSQGPVPWTRLVPQPSPEPSCSTRLVLPYPAPMTFAAATQEPSFNFTEKQYAVVIGRAKDQIRAAIGWEGRYGADFIAVGLGAMGGACMTTAFLGITVACGLVIIAPWFMGAAGLTAVAAAPYLAHTMKRRAVAKARCQHPAIDIKVAALRDIRHAFATLERRTMSEDAVHHDLDRAIATLDDVAASWARCIELALVAAAIAATAVGCYCSLMGVSTINSITGTLGLPLFNASQTPLANKCCFLPWRGKQEVHHHHYGLHTTTVETLRDPGIRVPMQSSWLAVLDRS